MGEAKCMMSSCDIFCSLQIPFYPIFKKDLTFIHLGNDSEVDGLINFEKLRMIAKEVRQICDVCVKKYVSLTFLSTYLLLFKKATNYSLYIFDA